MSDDGTTEPRVFIIATRLVDGRTVQSLREISPLIWQHLDRLLGAEVQAMLVEIGYAK